jgi:CheY-like chemotaxis protein
LLVEVWDTGIGIPEHAREMIFEEYTQLDNPERDRARGLGLGLAICRRLADLMAVPLGVRSRPGRGSVFWIRLPLASAAASSTAAGEVSSAAAEDPASIVGRVLVIDGDPMVRSAMERTIAGWGGRTVLAADRDEALRHCRAGVEPPDMVICNVSLPGEVCGIDLARELQRELALTGLPPSVLLVSADWNEATQAAARGAGFALLRQPVAPARLRAALRLPAL